jgi:hypothetical protein
VHSAHAIGCVTQPRYFRASCFVVRRTSIVKKEGLPVVLLTVAAGFLTVTELHIDSVAVVIVHLNVSCYAVLGGIVLEGGACGSGVLGPKVEGIVAIMARGGDDRVCGTRLTRVFRFTVSARLGCVFVLALTLALSF